MKLPTRSFRTLFHRGQLDQPGVAPRGPASLEGCLLSCSTSAASDGAWLEIAELGGLPKWTLTSPSGRFSLLDVRSLSEQQRQQILAAAADMGLVRAGPAYKVEWVDEDDGDTRYFMFGDADEDSAITEAVEEGRTLSKVSAFYATDKLVAFWNSRHGGAAVDLLEVQDAAIAGVIEATHSDIDGLFWDDRLDAPALSAPRAGLFQRSVSASEKARSKPPDVDAGEKHHVREISTCDSG